MSKSSRLPIFLLFAELAFFFTWGLYFRRVTPVIVDDGIYLNYARRVFAEGSVPYRDFFLPQGPVILYVLGLPQLLFGPDILIGRLQSILTALMMLACLFGWLREWAGPWAGILAVGLVGLNLENINGLCMVKTHVLTATVLTLGGWWAWKALQQPAWLVPAAFAFGLAVPTRVTSAMAAGCFGLWILAGWQKWGGWVWKAALAGVAGAVFPFLHSLAAGVWEQLWYNLISLQWNRADNAIFRGGILNKLDLIFSEWQFQAPLWVLLMGVGIVFGLQRLQGNGNEITGGGAGATAGEKGYMAFLCAGSFLISLIYFLPNTVTHTVYYLDALPYLAAVAAVLTGKAVRVSGSRLFPAFVAALVIFHPLTQCQKLLLGGLTTIRQGGTFQMASLEEGAAFLRKHIPGGKPVISFEVPLAYQAGLNLIPGLGEYLCYTPHWSRERCRKMATVNDAMLVDWVVRQAVGAVLLTEGDFQMLQRRFVYAHYVTPEEEAFLKSGTLPTLNRELLSLKYSKIAEIDNASQSGQTVEVWMPKP